jgi:hypothetical protein
LVWIRKIVYGTKDCVLYNSCKPLNGIGTTPNTSQASLPVDSWENAERAASQAVQA